MHASKLLCRRQTLKTVTRHNTNSFTAYQVVDFPDAKAFAGQMAEIPRMCVGMGKRSD